MKNRRERVIKRTKPVLNAAVLLVVLAGTAAFFDIFSRMNADLISGFQLREEIRTSSSLR